LIAFTTPASAASRTSSRDSHEFIASGFSDTTCLPAAMISLLMSKWR